MTWSDWTYWLSSIPPDEMAYLLAAPLLLDGGRYCFMAFLVWFYDRLSQLWGPTPAFDPSLPPVEKRFTPSVTLVVAGLNEGDSLQGTLERLYGTYPKLEIIVVDDGSTDDMAIVARRFAAEHDQVKVISKRRGGKSSAMNAGLALAQGEITVILDADSELAPDALWRIVQPLADPLIGAVSGNVRVRNAATNLLTQIQAFEYLRSVFLGRIVSARMGILGIVSGAFGAFRTKMLRQMGGWDVGPGEDEDLVLRIRKQGHRIAFEHFADCRTDAPHSWKVLTRQRRRWEWAVVTFESRKHIDMAMPWNRHFQFTNFLLFSERWLFNLLLPLWFWIYIGWMLLTWTTVQWVYTGIVFYLLYLLGDLIQYFIILDYSLNKRQDAWALLVLPVMPLYQAYQRVVTTIAIVEEIFTRRSFRDGFVPEHVRSVTWHW